MTLCVKDPESGDYACHAGTRYLFGSAIVTDVNTGDVKAYVSYPSYDNNYLTNEVDTAYYNQLLADKTTPLYNRASQQRTAPGSTYKPLVAIAGLTEE